jgi:hypothetical protein
MGRTGRKREGRVVFLLTEGKEQRDHLKSQNAYEHIQRKIAAGNEFKFNLDNSPRILPKEYQPDCVKEHIVPPDETLEDLELKVTNRQKKVPKRERDWSLPENVEKGFIKASSLGGKRKRGQENLKGQGSIDPETLGSPFLKSKGNIPAGSNRNRFNRTQHTIEDMDEVESTSSNLIASSLSERDINISPQRSQPELNIWADLGEDSSMDELPELSTKMLFKGKKDSDEEYGSPSEFELTPRKRIRIAELSDDEE